MEPHQINHGVLHRKQKPTYSEIKSDKFKPSNNGTGLKVIYGGYAKCGTKTIAAACRRLNLVVYDYEEMSLYTTDHWLEFYNSRTTTERRKEILYEMLNHADVVLDMPFYFYWKELMDVFPKAKVIFFAREEDQWYNSFMEQARVATQRFYSVPDRLHWLFNWLFMPSVAKMLKVRKKFIPLQLGETPKYFRNWSWKFYKYNEHLVRRKYRQNNADILQNCPKDKLLVLDSMNAGFKPICEFLNLPLPPDCEWPHCNVAGGRNDKFTYYCTN